MRIPISSGKDLTGAFCGLRFSTSIIDYRGVIMGILRDVQAQDRVKRLSGSIRESLCEGS